MQVTIPDHAQLETDAIFCDLMGRDPAARYRHIMEGSRELDEIDV